MKIRADEHVSVEVVRSVRAAAVSADVELDSVVEADQRGEDDEHWITQFGKSGGTAIVTADSDFVRRAHQVMAVHDVGLIVVHLPPKWANAQLHLQVAHLLIWWRRIEHAVRSANPLDCWRPEWNINENGALRKVAINYEDARK